MKSSSCGVSGSHRMTIHQGQRIRTLISQVLCYILYKGKLEKPHCEHRKTDFPRCSCPLVAQCREYILRKSYGAQFCTPSAGFAPPLSPCSSIPLGTSFSLACHLPNSPTPKAGPDFTFYQYVSHPALLITAAAQSIHSYFSHS